MHFQITQLDRRYKAFPFFQYYVEPISWPRTNNYLDLREWCWENYGPGCSIHMMSIFTNNVLHDKKYKWAWHDEEHRLYFKNESELSHLQLTWIK